MTSPRTPRQWNAGDPEPREGDLWRTATGAFLHRVIRFGDGTSHWYLTDTDKAVDVISGFGADQMGPREFPLSEVLPETPEPPPEGSYFDRTSFADEEAEAARAALVPVPASQSVPAVPVSSTGGKETGEAAETATEALSPVPYAEHERIVLEEIDRRDEAEEWADKLAAALAPPHVVGGHSLKNHPWRNALEWAQENRGPLPDSETEPCPNGECNQGMCGGISDPAGPCGGCCGCLSGCLDARREETS